MGGVPRGRIIEVYGPESSRETTLGLHIVAEAHKRGGVAGHIDAEHAMDIGSAHKLGVRTMRPSRDSSPAFKKAPQSRHSTVMQLPNSRFWVFWASTLAALGCSSGAPVADGGAGGDGGFGPDSGGFSAGDAGAFGDAGTEHGSDAGRTVAVRVTMRSTTLRTDAGSPLTWSELNASVALFTEAADGGLLEWPGSQVGDAVVFAHVPTGDYVVRYGRAFYVNASDDLDLGGTTHRRPDLKYVDAGTTLALNVAGLPAWNGTMTPNDDGTNADDLQLFSPSANLYAYAEGADLETHSTGDVPSLFRLDYAALTNGWAPLVDASKNDQLWLSYMQHQPIHHETVTWYFDDGGWADGDLGYNCQVSSLTALVSPQVHPGYNGVTVAFGQPPASVANLDWRRSQALERDREVHPQARNPYLEELYFVAEPNSYDSSADLIRCTGGNYPWTVLLGPDAGQPLDIRATIAVGDPYPTSWHRRWYWSVWRSAPSSLPADGGSSLVRANEWAYYENGEPIAPTVHPPTALRVNKGLATPSAAEPLLVEWAPSGKAPAPTRYRLYLRRRVPDGTTEGVAQVRTTATHFAFPPGVVEAGAVYYVRVAAERSSSPANRPFEGETTDHAEAVSDFFVPVR